MKSIYKYHLTPFDDEMTLDLPRGARILSVQERQDNIYLWALVDPKQPTEPRRFFVRGTGHEITETDAAGARYLGTVYLMDGRLVFHIFEHGEPVAADEPGQGTCAVCGKRVDDHNLHEYRGVHVCGGCRCSLPNT